MLTRKRKDPEEKQEVIEKPSQKRAKTEGAMTQSPAVTSISKFGVKKFDFSKSSSDLKAETPIPTSTEEQPKKESERSHDQPASSSQSPAAPSRFGVKSYDFSKESSGLITETVPRTSTKEQSNTIKPTFLRLDDFTKQCGQYQDFFAQGGGFENDTFNEGEPRDEIPEHHTTILNTMTENMSADFEPTELSKSKVVGISDYTSQTGRQICLITISGKSYNANPSDPGSFLYEKLNDNIDKLNKDDTTREYRYVFDISEEAQTVIATIKTRNKANPNRFCAEDKTASELLKFKFSNLSVDELKVDTSIPIKTNYYQVDVDGNYTRVPSCRNCNLTRDEYHQRTEPFNDSPPHSQSTHNESMFTFFRGTNRASTATTTSSSSSCSSEPSERRVVIIPSSSRG